MKFVYQIILIFTIAFSQADAAPSKWPKFDWEKEDPLKSGFDYIELDKAQQYAFDSQTFITDALLIIHQGKLIYERYNNGYQFDKKHRLWSISKSFTNALVGAALLTGKVRLKDRIHNFYPELKDSENKRKITLENLMHMSSGLKWSEGYEDSIFRSDVLKILYGSANEDIAEYVADKSSYCLPGSCFEYSSGDTNLVMGYLKKALGNDVYQKFPWTHLFDKLGIYSATWEQDKAGTYVGSSYLYMTPRDLAKFGLLYLREGKAGEELVLVKPYIDWSLKMSPAIYINRKKKLTGNKTYGAHWWINKKAPRKNAQLPYPNVPEDAFFALGHWGQSLSIIPSEDLVVVRLGNDRKEKLDLNKLLSLIISAKKDKVRTNE